MKKKRVNPNRRPASMADVKKAKQEAQDIAVELAWSIFFTVKDLRSILVEEMGVDINV